MAAVCLIVNESILLTFEQSSPPSSNRKLAGSHFFCTRAAGGVSFPLAFLARVYSGASFTVM